MDPITHAVIGMAVSKMSGNGVHLSDAVSTGIILGSVFPDIDIVLQKWGDYVYLKHHRGISHSFIGLAASSLLISFVLGGVYHYSNISGLFLWTFVGCLSHVFFDIFNSYGAKLLWPFCKRKISLSMLVIFDPLLIGAFLGYIFSNSNKLQRGFIGGMVIYIMLRAAMRGLVLKNLKRRFNGKFTRISLLPALTGIFRWHFILENENCNIVGEKRFIKSNIRIIQKLYKMRNKNIDKIICSPVGEFFSEFTPLYHIDCEKEGNITRYIFTDMRYYIKDDFLHHAILEMDEDNRIVKASFNPYSMNRSSLIPV